MSSKEIKELMDSGAVSINELFDGVEILEPGVVGLTRKVIAKTPGEKRVVLFERTKQLIKQNSNNLTPTTNRNILQEIGGGPLKENEYIQISELPNSRVLLITGTRGVFILNKQ